MKLEAAADHLPTPWLFRPAKRRLLPLTTNHVPNTPIFSLADCTDRTGAEHALNGDSWREGEDGNQICTCVNVEQVYFHVPPVPPGGTAYPPVSSCNLNGQSLLIVYDYYS